MIRRILFRLLLGGKGGETMMAMLLAQRIILGKLTYTEVPSSLKPAVKEILVESGVPELAEEAPKEDGEA